MERTIARTLIVLALLGAGGGILLAANEDGKDERCYALQPPTDAPSAMPDVVEIEGGEHPQTVCIYDADEIVLPPVPRPTFSVPGVLIERGG